MRTDPGVLYIVATPIGNLADMTERSRECLARVNFIAAEDTRHSRKLLAHFGITTPMVTLHDHNEMLQVEHFIQRIVAGESMALISDAGTPLISDPGYRLVLAAHEQQIVVVPIPGCSAVITALSAAGLPCDRFTFEGFLPAKSPAREQCLLNLVNETRTMIFYESPHRILDTLDTIEKVFGAERLLVVAHELTKVYESLVRGSAAEQKAWLLADPKRQQGEFVLLIAGANKQQAKNSADETRRILRLLLQELSVKKAVALCSEIMGLRKNSVYDLAISIQNQENE